MCERALWIKWVGCLDLKEYDRCKNWNSLDIVILMITVKCTNIHQIHFFGRCTWSVKCFTIQSNVCVNLHNQTWINSFRRFLCFKIEYFNCVYLPLARHLQNVIVPSICPCVKIACATCVHRKSTFCFVTQQTIILTLIGEYWIGPINHFAMNLFSLWFRGICVILVIFTLADLSTSTFFCPT